MIAQSSLLVANPSVDGDAAERLQALESAFETFGVPVHTSDIDGVEPALLEQLAAAGRRRLFLAGNNCEGALWRIAQAACQQGFDALVVADTATTDLRPDACGTAHTTSVASVVTCLDNAKRLEQAQRDGLALLHRIEQANILVPGRTEGEMSQDILRLAGTHQPPVDKFWHKRIVRVGRNTTEICRANPPDTRLMHDDIAFVDLGPVLGDIEADLGRAYVFGEDPDKTRMAADLEPIFTACQKHYWQRPQMTGAELYDSVVQACAARGWAFGHSHSGHLVGPFPHALRQRCHANNYIGADNRVSMSAPAADGELRHWILEVHLVEPHRQFGAFFEQLL